MYGLIEFRLNAECVRVVRGEPCADERVLDVGESVHRILEEVEPGRPNVLAWLRGSSPGPTICLTAHSDTVGFAAWPDRALNPVIEGDRMIGLGVADDKGACVAAMTGTFDS